MTRHKHRIALVIQTAAGKRKSRRRIIELQPHRSIHVVDTVTVGHTDTCTIRYLDQNGNVMLTTPTPDSPPAWTNGNAAVDTMSVSADGLTDVVTAVGAGADTIGVTAVVGGVSYSASLSLTVQAAPQVLTSIEISSVVS